MTFIAKNGNEISFSTIQLTDQNQHLLKDYKCGNEVLDEKFKTECATDYSSITKLIKNDDNDEIICLYSLNCASMILQSHGKQYPYPAVEIKNFATNITYQDMKALDEDEGCLSSVILYDLITQIFSFTDEICGANFIFLYSTLEGEPFYRKCGFEDFPIDVMKNDSRFLEECVPLCFKLR